MNPDAPDLPGFGQTDVLPGLAGIHRLVNSNAGRHVAAHASGTGAGVDDVRIGVGHRNGPHGARFEIVVGDVPPPLAAVSGLPDAAADAAKVERSGLAGDPRHRRHARAPVGSNHAVAQSLVEGRVVDGIGVGRPLVRLSGGRGQLRDDAKAGHERKRSEQESLWSLHRSTSSAPSRGVAPLRRRKVVGSRGLSRFVSSLIYTAFAPAAHPSLDVGRRPSMWYTCLHHEQDGRSERALRTRRG